MATQQHGKEPQKRRSATKRLKCMEATIVSPKAPKIKRKAAEVMRTVFNLLQKREKRKKSLTNELSADCFVYDCSNNQTLCEPVSTMCTDEIQKECCAMDKVNLSKSWSYFMDDPDLEHGDCVNKMDECITESYFEDDYWQDYRDDHDEFASPHQPGFHGIKMGLSSLRSLNTEKQATSRSSRDFYQTRVTNKMSCRRYSSLPIFIIEDHVSSDVIKGKESYDDAFVKDYEKLMPNYSQYQNIAFNVELDETETTICDQPPSIENPISLLSPENITNTEFQRKKHASTSKPPLPWNCIPANYCSVFKNSQGDVLSAFTTNSTKGETKKGIAIDNIKDFSIIQIPDIESQNETESDITIVSNSRTQSCFKYSEANTALFLEESKKSNTTSLHKDELPGGQNQTRPVRNKKQRIIESANRNLARITLLSQTPLKNIQVYPSSLKTESISLAAVSADQKTPDCVLSSLSSARLSGVLGRFDDIRSAKLAQRFQIPNVKVQTFGLHQVTSELIETLPVDMHTSLLTDIHKTAMADTQTPFAVGTCKATVQNTSKSPVTETCKPPFTYTRKPPITYTRKPPIGKSTSRHDNSQTELNCETITSLPLTSLTFNLLTNLTKDDNSSFDSHDTNNPSYGTIFVSPMHKFQIPTEYYPSETNFRTLHNHALRSNLPDFYETDANGNYTNQKFAPIWNTSTPSLMSSSPKRPIQKTLATNCNKFLPLHDFISPVRRNPVRQYAKYAVDNTHSIKRIRRLRKNLPQRNRFTVGEANNNSVASSDEELEVVSPYNTDYILLKKTADSIIDRIPLKKYIRPYVNMMRLMDYLRTHYMDKISQIGRGNMQSISEYRTMKTQSCDVFTVDNLSQNNCISQLLDSILVHKPSMIDACSDFVFENLHFLVNCQDFRNIPPELLLLLLCNDRSLVLGLQGFPLSYTESERELQKTVKYYIREQKSDNAQQNLHLERMFSCFLDNSSELKQKICDSTVLHKRPYYEIQYQCSEKFVTAENTRQEYLFQPYLSSVICSYIPADRAQSPHFVRPLESETKKYCNDIHTLRKMYFSYRRHNMVPYITDIGLQYVVRGRKVTYYVGQASFDPKSTPRNSGLNSSLHCKFLSNINAQSGTGTLIPDASTDEPNLNPSTAISSSMSTSLEDDSIISQEAEELKVKKTVLKLASGEHVTGIMVQGNSILHNIMIHTNKGRHIRAHGILDFPGGTVWTSIPPPVNSKFCLQAIYANTKTVSTRTYIRDICAVWAVLSLPLNNLSN